MHRYYGYYFVKNRKLRDITKLLKKAVEKREEEKAWDMWLTLYPDMLIPRGFSDKPIISRFIPFSEFFKLQTQPTKIESKEEIINKVNNIITSMKFEEELI